MARLYASVSLANDRVGRHKACISRSESGTHIGGPESVTSGYRRSQAVLPGAVDVPPSGGELGRHPRPGVEPPEEPELDAGLTELAVAEAGSDLGLVVPADLGVVIELRPRRASARSPASPAVLSCSATWWTAPSGTSPGSSKKVPRKRTVASCTAMPRRL